MGRGRLVWGRFRPFMYQLRCRSVEENRLWWERLEHSRCLVVWLIGHPQGVPATAVGALSGHGILAHVLKARDRRLEASSSLL